MSPDLASTTAVVTGASSGIGEATARALAAEGATVALLARRRERLDALVAELGAGASAHPVDVTDPDAVRDALETVATTHGGIDIVVNNAGTGVWGPALDARLEDWRRTVAVNFDGVLAVAHAALAHLVRAAEGRRGVADLVTVSSIAGRKVPAPGSNVYAATKHAVGAFSEALRQELAPRHVRVGLVEPGVVVTELTTSGIPNAPDATAPTGYGVLLAEDVADAIVHMVTRPKHAALNELLLRPTEQVV